ncbi:MAG: MBL fold metallo-hydrolase [Longimicrobiales bacterium]
MTTPRAAPPGRIDVVVVGSGTVALQPDRVCAGYYVETNGHRILLDCGPGTPHQLARFGLPWSVISHIALSHFHTDHMAGLPLLLFAMRHGLRKPRRDVLHIAGPVGCLSLLERLADAFGDYMRDPGFPLDVEELDDGDVWELDGDTRVRSRRTPHTESSVAFRIETSHARIGYTGDTGVSEDLADFFHDVDLLIAECSLPDEESIDSHLTPTRLAALARGASPRRLLVTHVYPQLASRDLPALIRAAGWEGNVELAHDGMRLSL